MIIICVYYIFQCKFTSSLLNRFVTSDKIWWCVTVSYVYAVYSNVNGSTPCPASSSTSTPVLLDGLSEGLLASAVTLETGVGGPACPWIIRVEPHQRINITLFDFSLASSPFNTGGGGASAARPGQQYRPSSGRGTAPGGIGGWDGPMSMPSWVGASCDEYAVVLEGGGGSDEKPVRNATVCGRRRRESPVYLSDTNVVQVRVDVAASRSHRFVLKYQGLTLRSSTTRIICLFKIEIVHKSTLK